MSRVSQKESSYPRLQFSDLGRLYAIFPDGAVIPLSEATNTQFHQLVESLLIGCHQDLRAEVDAVKKQWDAFARFWMMDTLLARRDGERITLYSSKEEALTAQARKPQKKELAA